MYPSPALSFCPTSSLTHSYTKFQTPLSHSQFWTHTQFISTHTHTHAHTHAGTHTRTHTHAHTHTLSLCLVSGKFSYHIIFSQPSLVEKKIYAQKRTFNLKKKYFKFCFLNLSAVITISKLRSELKEKRKDNKKKTYFKILWEILDFRLEIKRMLAKGECSLSFKFPPSLKPLFCSEQMCTWGRRRGGGGKMWIPCLPKIVTLLIKLLFFLILITSE